jgi:hypothetical protein
MLTNLLIALSVFAGIPVVYWLLMWLRPVPFAELAVSARHWFVIVMGLCGLLCTALLAKVREALGLPFPEAIDSIAVLQVLIPVVAFVGSVIAVSWYTRAPKTRN